MNNEPRPEASLTTAPTPKIRIDSIDGLRGFAALMIVVYHLFTNIGLPDWRPLFNVNLLRLLHDGWCGVNLFLVISGFCLFWPYASNPTLQLNFKKFMQRRARRLLPAYYASCIIVPLASIFIARLDPSRDLNRLPQSLYDIVLHALLLHSLDWRTINSMNEVSWSLGLEWIWYLVFPLAVWAFRRYGALYGIMILCFITLFYRIGLYLYFGSSASTQDALLSYTYRNFIAGRIFEFGLGMIVAWWLANRVITRSMIGVSIFLIPILFLSAHFAISLGVFLPFQDMLFGLSFALLILVTVSPQKNIIRSVFSSQIFQSIGIYSYSLYLFHLPLMLFFCVPLKKAGYTNASTFFALLLTIPVILWVCKGFYFCLEKPFMAPSSKRESVASIQGHAAP